MPPRVLVPVSSTVQASPTRRRARRQIHRRHAQIGAFDHHAKSRAAHPGGSSCPPLLRTSHLTPVEPEHSRHQSVAASKRYRMETRPRVPRLSICPGRCDSQPETVVSAGPLRAAPRCSRPPPWARVQKGPASCGVCATTVA